MRVNHCFNNLSEIIDKPAWPMKGQIAISLGVVGLEFDDMHGLYVFCSLPCTASIIVREYVFYVFLKIQKTRLFTFF